MYGIVETYKKEIRDLIIDMLYASRIEVDYNFDVQVTRLYNEKVFRDGIITDKEYLAIAKQEKASFFSQPII